MSNNLMCAEAAFAKSLMRCASDLIAKDFVLGTLDALGNIYQGQGEDRRLHETQDPGEGSSSRVCRGLISKLRKSAVNMTDAKSQPTSAMEVAGCSHVIYSKWSNCIDILDEALFKIISRNATSTYRQGVAFFLSDSLWSYTVSEGSRRGIITANQRASRHDDMYLYRDCGTAVGAFRIVKRTKELFVGFPYYVAIDLPNKADAWYLRADGTISHECNDHGEKRDANSGWFATFEDAVSSIKLYEEKKGAKQKC